MKKTALLWPALGLVLLAGACAPRQAPAGGSPAPSVETEVPAPTPGNRLVGGVPENTPSPEIGPLAQAIRAAILEANRGKYYPGEFQGVGYRVMETFQEEGVLSVYALTEYVEYGFEDGVFVNVSGTNPKALMRFSQTEGQDYDLIFYTRLDLLSDLPEEELETLVQPLADSGKEYLFTDRDLRDVRDQADGQAAEYLKAIGREAEVGVRQSHKGQRLTDLVSNGELLDRLFKDVELSRYPDWTGTLERVEDGARYLYQTSYDGGSGEIVYEKIEYESGRVVKRTAVDTGDS